MKIIRKRSGFTTNSSGASEWAPPPDLTDTPDLEPTPMGDGLDNVQSQTVKTHEPAVTPGLPAWSKPLLSIGIVGAVIVGVFVLERIIRKLWKKFKRSGDEK